MGERIRTRKEARVEDKVEFEAISLLSGMGEPQEKESVGQWETLEE